MLKHNECPRGEMVDTKDLKSLPARSASSSPARAPLIYMNIYDCTYFDEPLMMDVRFNVLNDYVKNLLLLNLFIHTEGKKNLTLTLNFIRNLRIKLNTWFGKRAK